MTRWSPRTLFAKLLLAFAVLTVVPLAGSSAVNLWIAYQEQRVSLAQLQRTSAVAAAQRITGFMKEIEGQLAWATQVPVAAGNLASLRLDALRVLRQSPAIVDLALVDGEGRERVAVSRVSLNRLDSREDRSLEQAFINSLRNGAYYGAVTFRRETEPFMTLAVAGARRESGVAIAEVNLKLIRDVVTRIEVGKGGVAWVVDQKGRLVAHPDISLVLSNIDLSRRVGEIVDRTDAAALQGTPAPAIEGLQGGKVLASYARIAPMGWTVVVELPEAEATEPVWRALRHALWIALGGLLLSGVLAVLLARRIVQPIAVLAAGAKRLGSGDLQHRITVGSADEIEELGRRFNAMADQIEAGFRELESQVAARTRELALANEAKTRFLAAASHDLRQPLHALSLLVGQLESERDPGRREEVSVRIGRAVADINGLFDGLLDISKLDSGVIAPTLAAVPLAPILARVRATFADAAAAKGLRLLVAPTRAWVRSDPQMLERIVQNLVGNAVRYTQRGGIVCGCRWGEASVRVEVWDSGIGIPREKQAHVFAEFFQVDRDRHLSSDGLGLGLAIVERLCALLQHPIELRSEPGQGTRFSLTLPREVPHEAPPSRTPTFAAIDRLQGRRVLAVDDDELVLQSTGGLLETWGCAPVLASSASQALEKLGIVPPDLVVSDFHLAHGEKAADLARMLQARFGYELPIILVSGDVTQATRNRAREMGLSLLDKPVRPMALRALATHLLSSAELAPSVTNARVSRTSTPVA